MISPPPKPNRPMRWSRERRPLGRPLDLSAGSAVLGVTSIAAAERLASRDGFKIVASDATLRAVEITGDPSSLRMLAAQAARDPGVRYLEALQRLRLLHRRNDPLTTLVDPATGRPYEWNFAAARLDRALNLSSGSPTVLVGVVDSGYSPVPDLAGKIAGAWFFTEQGSDPLDTEGHGTFVSSVIAANNDDGTGLAGFCGSCRLVEFRDTELFQFSVALAIRKLVDEHVRIINLSLGGLNLSSVMADALSYAFSNGVLVVASSGNEGSASVSYPAAFLQPDGGGTSPGLAVGSSTASGGRAGYSNYGSSLSLVAPVSLSGGCPYGVLGALGPSASEFDGSCFAPFTGPVGVRYSYGDGTSFAAPEVAGVAALVWAVRPELQASQVADIIKQSAARPAGSGWTGETGWGVLDAAAALEQATGGSSLDTVQVTSVGSTGAARPGSAFELDGSAAYQDGSPVVAGTAHCDVKVAGQPVPSADTQIIAGRTACTWRIPGNTGGKAMTVAISATDPDGVSGSASFSVTVQMPPPVLKATPRLVGLKLPQAERLLTRGGFTYGVTGGRGTPAARLLVCHQVPGAGARVRAGTRVRLSVAARC